MIGSYSQGRLARISREPVTVALLVCLTVFGTLSWLRSGGHLQVISLTAYDLFLRLLPRSEQMDPRIVLVTITEDDINALGEWPLSDGTLARILERLALAHPRVIGLDVYRDIPVPPGTRELETLLNSHPSIILINKFGSAGNPGIRAPAAMEEAGRVGFSDVVLDPGGKVRRGLLFLDKGEAVMSSFALQLALGYLRYEKISPRAGAADPAHIRLGETTLPPFEPDDGPYTGADAAGYQLLLDFRNGESPFLTLPLQQLLAESFVPDIFYAKAVIVGVAAESVKDRFFTPFTSQAQHSRGVPGIVLHAQLTSQLIRAALDGDRQLRSLDRRAQVLWLFAWCLLGATIGLRIHSPARFVVVVSTGLVLLGLVAFSAFFGRWWIPMITPALGWLGSVALVTAYLSGHERAQRNLLMQLFGTHVSDDVAAEIWCQRDRFISGKRLLPQELTATVLFTDIEHFTTISEALAPDELMDWLNTYMEEMANIVIEHGGVIDDYYGDAIKANFGVPIKHSGKPEIREDAVNALRCALDMDAKLSKINSLCDRNATPRLRMRMGICTGNVVAGCIGSAKRMKYTTVGDTINIAARLESFDKSSFGEGTGSEEDCRILIAESTWRLVKERFVAEPVGELSLKGKFERTSVFRIIGDIQDIR
jgi:adenylate cyclase